MCLNRRFSFIVFSICVLCACTGISVDGFNFGVLFEDVKGSPVQIVNNTGVDIVLFKDQVRSSNALGGVYGTAGQNTVGIKRIDGFYLMQVVTKEDLLDNETNPGNCRIIATFLVYVNSSPTVYTVRSANPGSGRINLMNTTDYYVDVKVGGFYDTTITYLGPKEERLQFLPYDDYEFFPVYLDIQRRGNAVPVIMRRFGLNSTELAGVFADSPLRTITFDENKINPNRDIVIYVKNLTAKGARFMRGAGPSTTILKSVLDREIINGSGGVQVYGMGNTTINLDNALHLADGGDRSLYYTDPITLNPGETTFLAYSGFFGAAATSENSFWTRYNTLEEFEAAK